MLQSPIRSPSGAIVVPVTILERPASVANNHLPFHHFCGLSVVPGRSGGSHSRDRKDRSSSDLRGSGGRRRRSCRWRGNNFDLQLHQRLGFDLFMDIRSKASQEKEGAFLLHLLSL